MRCLLREKIKNYHYTVWYQGGKQDHNLGDVFFDRESQTCSVRFYGWFDRISVSALEMICDEIRVLEQTIKARITQ